MCLIDHRSWPSKLAMVRCFSKRLEIGGVRRCWPWKHGIVGLLDPNRRRRPMTRKLQRGYMESVSSRLQRLMWTSRKWRRNLAYGRCGKMEISGQKLLSGVKSRDHAHFCYLQKLQSDAIDVPRLEIFLGEGFKLTLDKEVLLHCSGCEIIFHQFYPILGVNLSVESELFGARGKSCCEVQWDIADSLVCLLGNKLSASFNVFIECHNDAVQFSKTAILHCSREQHHALWWNPKKSHGFPSNSTELLRPSWHWCGPSCCRLSVEKDRLICLTYFKTVHIF